MNMIFAKFTLTIFCFCFWVSAFSQTTTINDTLVEEIVYEYDTVYLQPDTLRITETFKQINTPSSINAKKPSAISKFLMRNFSDAMLVNKRLLGRRSFLSRITPDYLSFGIAPFMNLSGEALKLPYSYTSVMVINMSYSLLWNYTYGSFVMSVGPGYTRYHDKQQSLTSHYTSDFQSSNPYSHDSLLITSKATSNLYYNYLNFYTFIGYKLTFSKKISLMLSGGSVTDILLSYRQGDIKNPAFSKIRKYAVNVSLNAVIAYKPNRNFELFISPYYQRLLAINNKYPFTSAQKTGIGLGFNLFLK